MNESYKNLKEFNSYLNLKGTYSVVDSRIRELTVDEFEDVFKPDAEGYYKLKLKELYDKLPKEVFIDLLSYDAVKAEKIHTRQYLLETSGL